MSARILIVDDDANVRETIARILQREGYQALHAHNGHDALTQIRMSPPDLILLDITMPDIDGFTVCRHIKNDIHTALIPVTMITGLDDRENRRLGLEAGADDFLTKPFDPSLLRARVRSQLRLKRLTDQLERTESVIFMLALAVEAKDSYTEGHLRRLSNYSEFLARALDLSPAEVTAIRFGGLLHDIGKIAIDDAILRKPGPLTEEEYKQVRHHPEYGAQIIAPMRFAADVGPIILGHHERWDGLGYPYGLRGTQIPIGARIVAVVDAFDAMRTDRPYREALDLEEALARLHEGRGKYWDSQLVDIFIHQVRSGAIETLEIGPDRTFAEICSTPLA